MPNYPVCKFNLPRGTLVKALRNLDPDGANVSKDLLGVVFEEANWHETGAGPLVRWFTGTTCNVYDGDVKVTR